MAPDGSFRVALMDSHRYQRFTCCLVFTSAVEDSCGQPHVRRFVGGHDRNRDLGSGKEHVGGEVRRIPVLLAVVPRLRLRSTLDPSVGGVTYMRLRCIPDGMPVGTKCFVAGTCRWTSPSIFPVLVEGVDISSCQPGPIPCSCV
jgi:hypothetical protein